MELGNFGSEGVVVLGSAWIIKDLIVPLFKKVIIPWWAHKILKKERANPNNTFRKLNPNSITLAEVVTSLKKHEEMDEKRTDRIVEQIEKLREKVAKHGEQLAVLESRSQ